MPENSHKPDTGIPPELNTAPTSAARKPRGKSFQPGNRHGKGRPPGSRNKLTILFQDTLDEYGPHILRKTLKMAMEGDRTALKLAVERLLPPVQGSRIALGLPPVRSTADLSAASAKVIQAVTRGDITLEEGRALTEMLDAHRRVLEADELASRIAALEQSDSGASAALVDVLQPTHETESGEEISDAS